MLASIACILCEPGGHRHVVTDVLLLPPYHGTVEQHGALDGSAEVSVESLLHDGEEVMEILDCVGFVGFPSNDEARSEVEVR